MNTLADIAKEASRLLNDSYRDDPEYDFTRWSQVELIHYATDALRVLVALYPKKFGKLTKFELVPGMVQELPSGCSKLLKILGTENQLLNGDANASIAKSIDDRLGNLFAKDCSEAVSFLAEDYKIDSFSIEENADKIFYVKPPVPVTETPVIAVAICAGIPADIDRDYTPEDWMHNLIIEWILYRAYGSEDESSQSKENSDTHLRHFYALLGNYVQADSPKSYVAPGSRDNQ